MTKLYGILITCLAIAVSAHARAVDKPEKTPPQLPQWQAMEFEQKAYWATAKSELEILEDPEDAAIWQMEVQSSVVSNSEQISLVFAPDTGRVLSRVRLSRGSGQRMKSYEYDEKSVVRERRNRPGDPGISPEDWPVSSRKSIPFPPAAADTVVTSPYLLILLAQRLQAQGPDKTEEVLVLTDNNFYRVRLTSGRGVPVDADYTVGGQGSVSGKRETVAVSIHASPEGQLADDDDFSLLGLSGNIIIFFDTESGLPLQISGRAPRIGDTAINLKSVAMRQAGK